MRITQRKPNTFFAYSAIINNKKQWSTIARRLTPTNLSNADINKALFGIQSDADLLSRLPIILQNPPKEFIEHYRLTVGEPTFPYSAPTREVLDLFKPNAAPSNAVNNISIRFTRDGIEFAAQEPPQSVIGMDIADYEKMKNSLEASISRMDAAKRAAQFIEFEVNGVKYISKKGLQKFYSSKIDKMRAEQRLRSRLRMDGVNEAAIHQCYKDSIDILSKQRDSYADFGCYPASLYQYNQYLKKSGEQKDEVPFKLFSETPPKDIDDAIQRTPLPLTGEYDSKNLLTISELFKECYAEEVNSYKPVIIRVPEFVSRLSQSHRSRLTLIALLMRHKIPMSSNAEQISKIIGHARLHGFQDSMLYNYSIYERIAGTKEYAASLALLVGAPDVPGKAEEPICYRIIAALEDRFIIQRISNLYIADKMDAAVEAMQRACRVSLREKKPLTVQQLKAIGSRTFYGSATNRFISLPQKETWMVNYNLEEIARRIGKSNGTITKEALGYNIQAVERALIVPEDIDETPFSFDPREEFVFGGKHYE